MDGNQENFEFTDTETGEVFPMNGTSLVSNVRDVLMSRRKMQTEATVWSKLSQDQQQDEITAMQELARTLVAAVVERVATKGMTCAHVEVTKFAVDVDKGEVVITSKGHASDDMLVDLAHAKGKTAKLTVVDVQQFNRKSSLMVPDPDQPSLLPDDEDPDTAMSAAMDDATQAAQLDDSEGLHSEAEPEVKEPTPEWRGGFDSRMGGFDKGENPFTDGRGTDEQVLEWDAGWDVANFDDAAPELKPSEAEPETTSDAEPEVEDAPADTFNEAAVREEGLQAVRDGKGPDENPYDGGTEAHIAWRGGFDRGEEQAHELREEGYAARKDGMAPTRCTWKKGSFENKLWMEGYQRAKSEETD